LLFGGCACELAQDFVQHPVVRRRGGAMAGRRFAALALVVGLLCAKGENAEQDEHDELSGNAAFAEEDDGMDDELTQQQLQRMHARIDKDNNGKVSIQELQHFAADMRKIVAKSDSQGTLQDMDSNEDGKVSMAEWLGSAEQSGMTSDAKEAISLEEAKFKAADINSDGFLAADELPTLLFPALHQEVLTVTAKHAMSEWDKDGDSQLTPKEFWQGEMNEHFEEIQDADMEDFKKLDTDANGFISIEELKSWVSGHFHSEEALQLTFKTADKDKDGHVTAKEFWEAVEHLTDGDSLHQLKEWAAHSEL